MSDRQFDTGDQRQVQRREKKAKLRRQRYDSDFRWLMGDERGRRLMWNWLSAARIYETSMAPTAEGTAFNEGRRNAGLTLMADIQRIVPAMYFPMVREAQAPTELTGDDDGGSSTDE